MTNTVTVDVIFELLGMVQDVLAVSNIKQVSIITTRINHE